MHNTNFKKSKKSFLDVKIIKGNFQNILVVKISEGSFQNIYLDMRVYFVILN